MAKQVPGIRQRSPGTWQITVYTTRVDAEGRYQRVIETLRGTRRQAEHRRSELIADLSAGRYKRPSRETVATYLDRWIESKSDLSPRTRVHYKVTVNNHIVPYIGKVYLNQLDAGHILIVMGKWREKGLADSTCKTQFAIMHHAISQAVRWKLISSNPMDSVETPKTPKRVFRILDEKQFHRLTIALDEGPNAIAYRLLIHTGIRLGELLGLRWKDVDLPNSALTIAQQYTHDKRFAPTKGNKDSRQINIDSHLVGLLRAHRAQQNSTRLTVGKQWQPFDLVCCNDLGSPLFTWSIRNHFTRTLRKLELPDDYRLHDLRHNHASVMLTLGVDLKVIQERLGHSSPAFTLSVYGHQMPGRQQEAAQRFADRLEQSSSGSQADEEVPG